MGKVIRLKESELIQLIKKSINETNRLKRIINEDLTDEQVKTFPPCVQQFTKDRGMTTGSPTGGYPYIRGEKLAKQYDWTGYVFFSNYRVQKPNQEMEYYFCKGEYPMLGLKSQVSKGGKSTSEGLGGNVLKMGSTGDAVKQVQNRLASSGDYGTGKELGGNDNCGKDYNSCDGNFGRNTYNAVIAFQKSNKISVDGQVGDETWQQLFGGAKPEEAAPVQTAQPEPKDQQSYRYDSSTGEYVSSGGVRYVRHAEP